MKVNDNNLLNERIRTLSLFFLDFFITKHTVKRIAILKIYIFIIKITFFYFYTEKGMKKAFTRLKDLKEKYMQKCSVFYSVNIVFKLVNINIEGFLFPKV